MPKSHFAARCFQLQHRFVILVLQLLLEPQPALLVLSAQQSTNISFSQTSGNASTNPCVFGGPAGNDSIIAKCLLDQPFLLTNQLAGNPISGGTWYNPVSNIVTNSIFDPANDKAYRYPTFFKVSKKAEGL